MAAFPGGTPTAADLDSVVPDRPVFLPNRDHHGAWVNTRALQIAGVTQRDTRPAARAVRARAGRATDRHAARGGDASWSPGTLRTPRPRTYYRGLLAGQSYLHSLGVTGWQDAIVGDYAGMDDAGPTYALAAQRGELTAHVVGALWWDRDRGDEQVASLIERRAEYTHGRFRATSVKVMQDGVTENYTAALTSPYLDVNGHPTAEQRPLLRRPAGAQDVRRAGSTPRASRCTSTGSGTAACGRRWTRSRRWTTQPGAAHHIAHLQLVHPDDVRRFGDLGVAANLQTLWACLDDQMVDLTLPFLGAERGALAVPVRRPAPLRCPPRRRQRLAGLDAQPARGHPRRGEPMGPRRGGPAGSEPFLPEQSLDLETAFAAYTSGSAWVNHRDDAGTIAPGQVADLVVLDRDPFAADPGEIGAAQVRLHLGGRRRRAPGLELVKPRSRPVGRTPVAAHRATAKVVTAGAGGAVVTIGAPFAAAPPASGSARAGGQAMPADHGAST